MSNSTFRKHKHSSYSLSGDLKYVLVEYDKLRHYRHSFSAKYSLFNEEKSSETLISLSGETGQQDRIQMVEWSPVDHSLAVVVANDLYFMKDALTGGKAKRLTESGKEGLVFNGIADWLYEEEILEQSRATWFSKDGGNLLYATFNATSVGEVSFKLYGDESNDLGTNFEENSKSEPNLYGKTKTLRYPKTGTPNPSVSLSVVNLKTFEQISVTPPKAISSQDHYFTSVSWIDDETVSITWMNRVQNVSTVSKCQAPAYRCGEVYFEKSEYWVKNRGAPTFSKTGKSMVVIRPVQDLSAGFWPQIVQVDVSGDSPSTELPISLTHGQFEVTKILGWDETSHYVYYLGTLPGRPDVRHVFRVQDASTHNDTTPVSSECLSCNSNHDLVNVSTCQYARAKMSKDFSHYALDCMGPTVPYSLVFSLPKNEMVKVLDLNHDLQESINKLAMPKTKFFNYDILEGATAPARVKLLLPPGFREEELYTFALVVQVYGGPGHQKVSQRWSFDWDHYLAGNRDFLVATLDVRGSGYSGDSFKHAVYKELGTYETQDTLKVIKHMVSNISYIDDTRVAVWGWSYGGYLAAQLLAEDDRRLISCAVSVAPVVKWQLYDSAYTERYMGLPGPDGNWKGYDLSDLSAKAAKFHGKNFFLIHGTADDNVHFQQSMVLTRALVDYNILFRLQIYPGENHLLSSSSGHLYTSMEGFFRDCMGPLPAWFTPQCQEEHICYV